MTPTAASADVAITRRAARQLRNGALWIGLTFGTVAGAAAVSYVQSYPTAASRARLAASIKGDTAFSVLFGRIDGIDTVGGYTAYKTFALVSTIGAVWGALAATRLLRGEEDAGRWQLLLTGRTTAARVTVATLAALSAALGVVFLGTALPMALAGMRQGVGTSVVDDVVLGLSAVVAPVVFMAVGAVCSQLAQTRRLANGLSIGVLGVAYVLRMIADSGPSTHWLLWATPLGWVELIEPMATNDPWPLLPTAVVALAGGALAVRLASARDAGGGVLVSQDTARERPRGLGSPLGLAVRLTGPVLAAWAVGIAATGLVMGTVAKPAASALTDSDVMTTLRKLGATGSGAKAYLGVVFLFLGAVLALVPAAQIGAAADEETSGRLGQIVAGRSSRLRWLTGRLAIASGAVVVLGVASGAATWTGARSQGLDLGIGPLIGAGLNIVPPALLALAVGAVTLAVAPARAGLAVYAIVAWSFVIDLLGSLVPALKPFTHLSLFHYVALAPARAPDWTALSVMVAVALGLAGTSIALLERRDLARD